ncbi:MAG: rhamnan synthesis F family protein [Bernardetiaceae bacterium]|nr:rhamnan synthesis F family protein [Bernardetiaceae bacterium]
MPNTLCLFSSYFEQAAIPNYIRYYLLELRKHAQELWLLSNKKVLTDESEQFLAQHNIRILLLPNKGYDFGQWYAALQQIDLLQFDRLILANDSCILFRPLDTVIQWFENSGLDYAGITDSIEDAYHVQSYFLMANKNALPPIAYYFQMNGIAEGMGKRRRKVIETYEIGLSQYLLSQQLSIGAMICYEQSGLTPPRYNMALHMTGKLPLLGVPMIKRRFLTGEFSTEELLNFIHDADFYLPADLKRRITYFCRSISIKPPDWTFLTGKKAQTTLTERLHFARQLIKAHPSCIYNWIHRKDFTTGWLALWHLFFLKKQPSLLWHGLYWSFQRIKLMIDAIS